MKLTIERASLIKSLNHVQSVVERRNTIPILSNVLIDAANGEMTLRATDLDIEIFETTPAEIATPGSITVPAHICYDIMRKFPDGVQVELETCADDKTLSLRSGRACFNLQTLPKDDFPDLGAGDSSHHFKIAADDLKHLLDKTRFAMSSEETRYYLNGIHMHTVELNDTPMLRAVATDGHRLARLEIPAPEGSIGMPGIIIPRKTVIEVGKLLDDQTTDIEIALSSSKIRFLLSTATLTSKLIDGTFPDYERVIPQGNDKVLRVDNRRFIDAVDRVSTISSERGRAIKLSLETNQMTLSVNNPESGNAREEIEVDYTGTPLEIGFNARYLLDIANQLKHEEAYFAMAEPDSPTLVKDLAHDMTLYVIMPMRV